MEHRGLTWARGRDGEEGVAARLAEHLFLRHIGYIAVDVEDHINRHEPQGCVRVGCCIVEELGEGVGVDLGSFGLGGGKEAKGRQHHALYGAGIY